MKILVTGGSGFIGTYVCEELQNRGIEVLVMDHSYKPNPLFETFLADVRDSTAVTEAAAHVDGVIHLAAVLGTQETISNPRPAAETNIIGALNVFEAANQYNLPVVYAGVGNHWMRNYGTGAYTISKTAAEDFTRMFNKYRGSSITVVRPVNAYGPRQSVAAPYGTSKVRKIMPAFICRALTGNPIEVYGDGLQISDCVYVKDVAKVFVESLLYTHTNGVPENTIEVGPWASFNVNEIADRVRNTVAELMDKQPVELTHLPMRPGEVPNAVVKADTDTLHQIGIDPESFVRLKDGIQATVEWYAENWLNDYLEVPNV